MSILRWPMLVLLTVGWGCGPPIRRDLVERHVIALDGEGFGVHPVSRERLPSGGEAGDLEKYIRGILEAADRANDARGELANAARECPCIPAVHEKGPRRVRRLLIHAHGGMNDPGSSLAAAQASIEAMREEQEPGDWYYPVFVTWPSGPLSSYADHLLVLRQGQRVPALGYPTAPLYLVTDLLLGVANSPRSWLLTAVNDTALAWKVAFDQDLLAAWRNADRLQREARKDPPVFRLKMGTYRRGGLAQSGRLVLYWLFFPAKVVTSLLALDSMGARSWDGMLHRAGNTFRRPEEFDARARRSRTGELREALERPPSGAFSVFLRELRAHINREQQKDPGVCYEIVLVGHSMGAIILNQVLHLFPRLPVSRIVYMAPACSIAEAEQALVPFLREHRKTKFHLLTLHPQADADEMNAADLVPRGSLLEWIDNWYTRPSTHLDRRLGKWVNVVQALHVFKAVRDRFTLKAFGVDGASMPEKHGELNLCPFWKETLWDPDGPMLYRARQGAAAVPAPGGGWGEDSGTFRS